jgi:dihydrofolate reductase
MRRIVYDVAVSLDGYIAGENDDISAFPGEGDHVLAYLARLDTYQTVIMGRRTYEFGYRFGLVPGARAYPHMDHYVFSRSLSVPGDAVTVVQEDWLGALRALRGGEGGDIYLCGGGTFAGFVARTPDAFRHAAGQTSTTGLKPPKISRLPSNGIGFFSGSIRGSAFVRIVHPVGHLRHGGIAGLLVRPLDPGEDDRLVGFGLNGLAEIGDLAVGHVVAPALDHARGAEVDEHAVALPGVVDELLLVRGRDRDHEPVDVAHPFPPSVSSDRGVQRRDVDLPHRHHRLEGALRGVAVGLVVRSSSRLGVICQEKPQRSLHQPQALSRRRCRRSRSSSGRSPPGSR